MEKISVIKLWLKGMSVICAAVGFILILFKLIELIPILTTILVILLLVILVSILAIGIGANL